MNKKKREKKKKKTNRRFYSGLTFFTWVILLILQPTKDPTIFGELYIYIWKKKLQNKISTHSIEKKIVIIFKVKL